MTYRERREARAESLEEWAEKREQKAVSEYERARQMASVIPFGQPILVGHHSERRDRNYRNRIASTMDRSIEDQRKAESMTSRAGNIRDQLDSSIYDDDADAIERLTEKLAKLEAEREAIKAHNKAMRKACDHPADCDCRRPFARVCDCKNHPLPSYALQNLGGRITQIRQRIERLSKQAARVERAEEAGGVAVEPLRGGYVSVTFTEKPAREVLDSLKAAGFRWAKGSWVGIADQLPEGIA